MDSLEKISHSIALRLEQVCEEADRLQAALDALDGDAGASLHIRRNRGGARSAFESSAVDVGAPAVADYQRQPVKARRGVLTPPTPDEGTGDRHDATPGTPAQRAISQLRRELAAGLRNR